MARWGALCGQLKVEDEETETEAGGGAVSARRRSVSGAGGEIDRTRVSRSIYIRLRWAFRWDLPY